jgi:AcrR family transcriptional regulator
VKGEPRKDRRVQKTQRLLREALVSLIHEKSYDSIVIKEILDRANVGRSAFYAHFHDKDALLASGIHQVLHAIPPRPLPFSAERFGKAVWFSLPVFEFIGQCQHRAQRRMSKRGRAIVHHHLRQVLTDRVADDVRAAVERPNADTGAIPTDLLVEYIVATFILVLDWWVESRSPLSPREADDVFLSMVLPTLAAIADRR